MCIYIYIYTHTNIIIKHVAWSQHHVTMIKLNAVLYYTILD